MQRLPFERPRAGREITARPGHRGIVGQQALGQGGCGAGEIAPVVVVAHAVEVEVEAQATDGRDAGLNGCTVRGSHAPAAAVAQPVCGHHVAPNAARIIALEVAKFRSQVHPALGHQRGNESGVPVRGDVPVVRQGHLGAVDVAQPHGGRQKAGFAPVAQGKAQVRHRQDGHALEAQHRAFGHARVFFIIQAQGGSAQNPVGQPARAGQAAAGGEGGIAHHHPLVINEVGAVRLAMPAVEEKAVLGLDEKAFKRLHLELQQRPFVHVASPVDAHIAPGTGQVVGLVVLQPVGPDDGVAPAQNRIAFQNGFEVGAAGGALAKQKRGLRTAC